MTVKNPSRDFIGNIHFVAQKIICLQNACLYDCLQLKRKRLTRFPTICYKVINWASINAQEGGLKQIFKSFSL